MKKLYYILLLAVISMTFAACDEWDSPYYVDDIVGSWESYYGYDGYGEYDIRGYDVVRYDFYSNYTGRYTFYSKMGLSYVDFDWDTNGHRLKIWYADGDYEDLYYGFNDYGYLILSLSRRYHQYTVYRPAGFYYEQGKSIDPTKAKKFDPAYGEKPKLSTMMSATKASAIVKE